MGVKKKKKNYKVTRVNNAKFQLCEASFVFKNRRAKSTLRARQSNNKSSEFFNVLTRLEILIFYQLAF